MTRVAIAIIKHPKENKHFLIRPTREFREYSGHYYPPGGHIKEGESIPHGLTREIKEELGLIVEPIREIAVTPGDIERQITHWWECGIVGGELSINQTEIADAGYFSKEERERMPLWPATKAFFRDNIDTPKIKREREV